MELLHGIVWFNPRRNPRERKEEGRAQSVPQGAMDTSSETLALRRQLEKAVSSEVSQIADRSRPICLEFCE